MECCPVSSYTHTAASLLPMSRTAATWLVRSRLRTGVFLLKQLLDQHAVTSAFDNILQAAHMRRHNIRGDRYGYGPGPGLDYRSIDDTAPLRTSKARNRSVGGSESFVLNNITSLLSPQNLKKIE